MLEAVVTFRPLLVGPHLVSRDAALVLRIGLEAKLGSRHDRQLAIVRKRIEAATRQGKLPL